MPLQTELTLPPHVSAVDFVSDVHLDETHPATQRAFMAQLAASDADVIVILGDLFEVWVGDDALADVYEASAVAALAQAARGRPLYVMHGNRDFLLGQRFAAAARATLLADPCLLRAFGAQWLLSHGDALCLADAPYQRFRQKVRQPEWQAQFLAQPLAQRRAQARGMREHSVAHQRDMPAQYWADVDHPAALQALQAHGARHLVHGHTHRPAVHALDEDHQRWVLSDWQMDGPQPPRGDLLRLSASGLQRRSAGPAP